MATDLLKTHPELRSLRDRLLIVDADAKALGSDLLSKFLMVAALEMPLPDDRLLETAAAAALAGVLPLDFHEWAGQENLAPVRKLTRTSYWRAGDIYAALRRAR